jgi:predicted phosphodiesterase
MQPLSLKRWAMPAIIFAALTLAFQSVPAQTHFTFITAGDMRNFMTGGRPGQRGFDGLCKAVHQLDRGAFMLSPGDCDDPVEIRATIDKYIGKDYLWYPVVGNHDVESLSDMAWLRQWASNGIPHLAERGPAGCDFTYSFDFADAHFAAVSEYDGRNPKKVGEADITDVTLDWLKKDLSGTRQPLIFVFGHNPIKSFPDMDSGRVRHGEASVSANPAHFNRFIKILTDHHVCAYVCGHTHDTSVEKVDDIWQTDSGHARGADDPGSPSTFLRFRINGTKVLVEVYWGDPNGVRYKLRKTVELN